MDWCSSKFVKWIARLVPAQLAYRDQIGRIRFVPGVCRWPCYCALLVCVLKFSGGLADWHFPNKHTNTQTHKQTNKRTNEQQVENSRFKFWWQRSGDLSPCAACVHGSPHALLALSSIFARWHFFDSSRSTEFSTFQGLPYGSKWHLFWPTFSRTSHWVSDSGGSLYEGEDVAS